MRLLRNGIIITLLAAISTSCVKPVPITPTERRERVSSDLHYMFNQQEPLVGSLNLDQALARAIKYNMEIRLKSFENAFALADMQATNVGIMPRLLSTAGYNGRNNQNGLVSPENPNIISVTEDRDIRNYNVQMGWNSIDFVLAYMQTKQKANAVLIAEEKKRKAIQQLVKETRTVFFKAWAAQKLLPEVQRLKRDIQQAVQQSRKAEQRQLMPPEKAAYYQSELWKNYKEILALERILLSAEPELMALINAAPKSSIKLKYNEGSILPGNFPKNTSQLQAIALHDRPELREEDYQHKISVEEVTKEMLRLFPTLEINGGLNYDSNSFLINNRWNNIGVGLSWDVFQAIFYQHRAYVANRGVDIANQRRQVLSMAVMTQVAIAKIQYERAVNDLVVSRNLRDSRYRYYRHLNNKYHAKLESEHLVIEAKSKWILAKVAYYLSLAEAKNEASMLLLSIGYDPLCGVQDIEQPVDTLAKDIHEALKTMHSMEFVSKAEPKKGKQT